MNITSLVFDERMVSITNGIDVLTEDCSRPGEDKEAGIVASVFCVFARRDRDCIMLTQMLAGPLRGATQGPLSHWVRAKLPLPDKRPLNKIT